MNTQSSPPRRTRAFVILILAVAAVAGGLYLWQVMRPATQTPQQRWGHGGMAAVPVRAAVAVRDSLPVQVKALGTVTPLNTVVVRSRVDGELVRVAFEEGQHVQAGDLLAEIDPQPYRIRVAQAEGQQQQNLAELENARIELARYQELRQKGYVSAQDLSNLEARVRQYEARRQTDRAAVDEARLQLQYTRITAPVSGRVGLRAVDVGNLVSASGSNGLVTITQMQPISVVFAVPEVELPALIDAVGGATPLPVQAWDREERRVLADGELSSLDNLIDTATGTLRLRANFENTDGRLFPNQFVNVRMRVSELDAVVLPDAAVQYGATGAYVFVITDENTISLRNVQLGAADAARIAILEGVDAGERVVIEGLDRLREGSKVEVVADADGDDTADNA